MKVETSGQSLINITENVMKVVQETKICNGLINLSVLHTSASIIVQENASDEVLRDLLAFFNKLVPMDSYYEHSLEGVDDMPAHIKTALTKTNVCFSILNSNLILGKWQGIFLFEHKIFHQTRKILAHTIGI